MSSLHTKELSPLLCHLSKTSTHPEQTHSSTLFYCSQCKYLLCSSCIITHLCMIQHNNPNLIYPLEEHFSKIKDTMYSLRDQLEKTYTSTSLYHSFKSELNTQIQNKQKESEFLIQQIITQLQIINTSLKEYFTNLRNNISKQMKTLLSKEETIVSFKNNYDGIKKELNNILNIIENGEYSKTKVLSLISEFQNKINCYSSIYEQPINNKEYVDEVNKRFNCLEVIEMLTHVHKKIDFFWNKYLHQDKCSNDDNEVSSDSGDVFLGKKVKPHTSFVQCGGEGSSKNYTHNHSHSHRENLYSPRVITQSPTARQVVHHNMKVNNLLKQANEKINLFKNIFHLFQNNPFINYPYVASNLLFIKTKEIKIYNSFTKSFLINYFTERNFENSCYNPNFPFKNSKSANLGNALIITGGIDSNTISNEVFLITLIEIQENKTIKQITKISKLHSLNYPRESHNILFIPNHKKIFVVSGQLSKTCETLDINSLSNYWEVIPNLNKIRANATMFLINDSIVFCVGGYDNKEEKYQEGYETININNIKLGWKLQCISAEQLELCTMGVVVINKNKILLVGGYKEGKKHPCDGFIVNTNKNGDAINKIEKKSNVIDQGCVFYSSQQFFSCGGELVNFEYKNKFIIFNEESFSFTSEDI